MNEVIIENNPDEVGSVAAWQNILNGCGYNPELIITGWIDEATVAATKTFQKNLGLSVTGEVDLKTWAAGLAHGKLSDWSEVTPLISVRRNLDPAADVRWSKDSTNKRWSKKELTQKLIEEAEKQGLSLKTQWAYMMATIEWETAHTFEPVREAFWLSEEWREKNLRRYFPYYGRGYVQLTWKSNYEEYEKHTGLKLVDEPDLAMKPEVALYILIHGFKHGTFTKKHKLEDYVNAGKTDFRNARKCINWLDKAGEIKELAEEWEEKL